MHLGFDATKSLLCCSAGADPCLLVPPLVPPPLVPQAVKDAYLPSTGVWLTEYPFADRNAFLEVSLAIEQEAQAAAAAAADPGWQQQAQAQQQQGPGAGQGYGGRPY